MPVPSPRVVLYARKSTDREDKQILSIPAQLDELRDLAARQGLVVAEELTESWSAREPGRPVFSKLLKDVEAGRVEGILCWKLDRLARNPIDGGALIHHLGKGRLQSIVTVEGAYTGTSDTKFMLSVLFGAATKYTDDLSLVVKRGNKAVWERGRITFRPPLGYMKIRDREGYRGAGPAVADPERFPLVKKLWSEMLAGTTTVPELWRKAQGWGLTTRPARNRPAKPMTVSGLYQLFQCRFYTGQIAIKGGDVYQGEHEPMISVADFERVQELLGRKDAPRPKRHEFLYRGLLHCGDCGRLLVGEEHVKKSGLRFVYYRCGRRRLGYEVCRAPMASEGHVNAAVEEALRGLVLPEAVVAWIRDLADAWVAGQRETNVAIAEERRREVERVDAQIRRLTDLALQDLVGDAELVARRAELLERRASLARVDGNAVDLSRWRATVDGLLDVGETMARAFREGTDDERRALLGRVYANFIVNDRKAAPVLRLPFDLVGEVRDIVEHRRGGDANLPPPSRFLRQNARSALRGGTRDRALQAWWASLRDVRTATTPRAAAG